jgi:hypothetical protein
MNCPVCQSPDDVQRTLTHNPTTGYVAAIICTTCNRQIAVTRDDPGDALGRAGELFEKGGVPDAG